MYFLRFHCQNTLASVSEQSGLWNILFADALDTGSFDKHFPPNDYSVAIIWVLTCLLLHISHLILLILVPSVGTGVKLHIDVYWLPTVFNKKWDLLGEKAGSKSEYLSQTRTKTQTHGWLKLFAPPSFPFQISSYLFQTHLLPNILSLPFSPLVFFSTF